VRERDSGQPRGFGFVEMTSDAEGEKAIAGLNGSLMEGSALSVNEARPKRDRVPHPAAGVVEAAAAGVTEGLSSHAKTSDYGRGLRPFVGGIAAVHLFRENVHNQPQRSLYHRRCHLCIQIASSRRSITGQNRFALCHQAFQGDSQAPQAQ
jgi:RNA recognition motif-containing protein